jgi:hypothetical protein
MWLADTSQAYALHARYWQLQGLQAMAGNSAPHNFSTVVLPQQGCCPDVI